MTESHFNNIDSVISDLIINSRKTIKIATAWLTHKELIRLLQLQASLYDLTIKIIISDNSLNEKFFQSYESLTQKGIEFRIYKKKNKFNLMHHKFSVFDSETVVTGSFNWTNSAETNLENIMVSEGDQNVINKFSEEFNRIFDLSEELIDWKNRITIKKPKLELDDSKLWEFLREFHKVEYNPTPQRLWRAIKGTRSRAIKDKTCNMSFYNSKENYSNLYSILKEIEAFFIKYSAEINEEFQYQERGWNRIDFPGIIYCTLSDYLITSLENNTLDDSRNGKKWSNQELIVLKNYLSKTNNPKLLSLLLNRNENSIIHKSRRLIYNDPALLETWKRMQQHPHRFTANRRYR